MLRFGLIGDGIIAERHKKAIEHIGGKLINVYDPNKKGEKYTYYDSLDYKDGIGNNHFLFLYDYSSDPRVPYKLDYIVICSPTIFHRKQIKWALENGCKVITEKPMCLPWQPLIDDNRINVTLQLRYLDLPKKADLVKVTMVRDDNFWNSWKGDYRKTGGFIYEFFIHYLDLAIKLNADFEGLVIKEGQGERKIYWNKTQERLDLEKEYGYYTLENDQGYENCFDIIKVDMQLCYNKMYEDIVKGEGIKPKDIFYLHWILNKYSERNGYLKYDAIDKKIFISKEYL